jgi:twinkle protein
LATTTEPCPKCREEGHDSKGDNATVYEDGGVYCHARHGVLVRSDGGVPEAPPEDSKFRDGHYQDLPHRRIRMDTCKKYRYKVTDEGTEISTLFKSGKVHAQQLRASNAKDFISIGQTSTGEFFGQHTCRGVGGKWLVVTEGAIDCMSVAQHGPWDVVSLTNGVKSAEANFKNNLEFVNGYESVFLCFDNDEAGELAVEAVKDLVRPGKVKITSLRLKDANEYLTKGSVKDLISDIWASAAYAPPGIISASEVDRVTHTKEIIPYVDTAMNRFMLGREVGNVTCWVSGTGCGKSTFLMRQVEDDLKRGYKVGGIFLETTPCDMMMDIAGLRLGRPIRKLLRQRQAIALDPNITNPMYKDDIDDDVINREYGWVQTRPLHMWNPEDVPHYETILSRMEYLSIGLGCKTIYLDHMSLMNFGDKSEIEGLDDFAIKLKSLVLRCPSHFTVVSQLSQGDSKKTHEEGGKILEKHIRGSQRVVSVFNETMTLTRNKTAEDQTERNTTRVSCMKSRLGGETGYICSYQYDQQTGRMAPTGKSPMDVLQDTAKPQHDFNMNQL